MFTLLLDEHLDPLIADALRVEFPGLDVQSIHATGWKGLPDPALLAVLDEADRVLVTRDVNSMPGHVRQRLQEGAQHAGVIYADSKRLKQTDIKGIIRRLGEVVRQHGETDWRCREGSL